MKREEKSNILRNKILIASRTLFIKQGYSKTTMRQILGKTGLTTGSLYHFFRNKEDILKQAASAYLEESDRVIRSLLNDYDPIVHYIMVIYIQLKVTDNNIHLTDIWHNAYSLWSVLEMRSALRARRNKTLFGTYNGDMTDDEWFSRSLAINGVLHNIIIEKFNRGTMPLLESLRLVMHIVSSLFNLPVEKIEPSIVNAEKIMNNNRLQLYGIKV